MASRYGPTVSGLSPRGKNSAEEDISTTLEVSTCIFTNQIYKFSSVKLGRINSGDAKYIWISGKRDK